MWRDETVSPSRNMDGPANGVLECRQAVSDDLPCPPVIVPLEVPHIFEHHKWGLVLPQNLNDLVKQSSARAITASVLESGLREGLTRESSTQNVVLGHLLFEMPNVAEYDVLRFAEVLLVQVPKLFVDLRYKDTLMS